MKRQAMLAAWLAGTMLAGGAAAQVAPDTIPDVRSLIVPTPTPTPVPTPTPSPTPTPRPTPTATPTPSARATPASQPSARATPASRPTATPTPRPLATPTPAIVAPVATPSSTPTPAALATPTPTPEAVATPLPADGEPARPAWLIPAALIALALGGAAWFVRRRRREPESYDEAPIVAPPEPPPPAAPLPPIEGAAPPLVPVAPAPRFLEPAIAVARLDLDPPTVARAGVNLVTATADVTVTVRNVSDVPATGVALEVRLTSAQPGQDAAVAAMFADAVARPATAPFDLAPGESRRIRTLATMPRDDIVVLTAAERPMFVPVVAIRAAHAGGQTVSVHALGIERPGQAKLGPFWLDQPPRMFDAIGVRPHTGRG